MALENLEPATRIEAILDGKDIAPATRLEYFLAKAAEGGGNGESGVMYFEITGEGTYPNIHYVSSKTYAELMSAIESGVIPICIVEDSLGVKSTYYLNGLNPSNIATGNTACLDFVTTVPVIDSGSVVEVDILTMRINESNEVTNYSAYITLGE